VLLSSGSEPLIITVEIPEFDVRVHDPLSIRLEELLVKPSLPLPLRIGLPPIISVEPPLIETETPIAQIPLESLSIGETGFDDLVTAIPVITGELVRIAPDYRRRVEKILRRRKISGLKLVFKRVFIEVPVQYVKGLPRDVRKPYEIRLRLRRVSPEIREILENRITKEFRVTRMIKRMEVISDTRSLTELEMILRDVERKLRLWRLTRRSSREQ
jgi:hypothetical protein